MYKLFNRCVIHICPTRSDPVAVCLPHGFVEQTNELHCWRHCRRLYGHVALHGHTLHGHSSLHRHTLHGHTSLHGYSTLHGHTSLNGHHSRGHRLNWHCRDHGSNASTIRIASSEKSLRRRSVSLPAGFLLKGILDNDRTVVKVLRERKQPSLPDRSYSRWHNRMPRRMCSLRNRNPC